MELGYALGLAAQDAVRVEWDTETVGFRLEQASGKPGGSASRIVSCPRRPR